MVKIYRVTGYAVNRRGHTVGIQYDVVAGDAESAKDGAWPAAIAEGYQHIRFTRSTEWTEADHA
ncbi:hypothetical protein [Serratia ureilytica]|uniref:hypothetical protein n=1 Tax=Serratia ureilytica TaxID=300181 RepID=UPI00191FD22E|nr:hypothetical protein [Serratia ureilytica]MBL0878671.1 hypothetical protein [Serratia ureilytica]MDN2470933.1 hypothetical protein [Serratia ureilytica]